MCSCCSLRLSKPSSELDKSAQRTFHHLKMCLFRWKGCKKLPGKEGWMKMETDDSSFILMHDYHTLNKLYKFILAAGESSLSRMLSFRKFREFSRTASEITVEPAYNDIHYSENHFRDMKVWWQPKFKQPKIVWLLWYFKHFASYIDIWGIQK